MSGRYLWRFGWNYRRMGSVAGMFVATEEQLEQAYGKRVYFGEILGKHSEVYGTLDRGDVQKMELKPETVEEVTALLGETWSGYNPLKYIDDEGEEDE